MTAFTFRSFFIKKINLSSKDITYGAIFAASSASLIILLITFTPIAALPTIRIAFEGILIKLSGYLFGAVVGFISGNITEILIALLRPTFLHWAYYLTIVLYGVFGGVIKFLKTKPKYSFESQIFLLAIASIIFAILATIMIINNDGFVINFKGASQITFSKYTSLFFLYGSQALILLILPFFYFILTYLLPRYYYLFYQIAPIYFLSILTGYFITIPITTLGDSASYQQPYQLLMLVAIAQVPLNVIVNMFVIFFVWRILNGIIMRSSVGKYNSPVETKVDINYYFNKIKKNTAKYSLIWKLINIPISKKIKFFEFYEKHSIFSYDAKIICVTGTNGKSSVCQYISKYLSYEKIQNGLFISPHIFSMNERIQINNNNLTNRDLKYLYYKIYPYSKILGLSFFEYIFFMGASFFYQKPLKYIIIEGGIGAKKDICGNVPHYASIITNISMDHKKYFGNSNNILDVAKNKIHISTKGGELFINENNEKILNIYNNFTNKINCKITNFNRQISIMSENTKIGNLLINNEYKSYQELENLSLSVLFIKKYIDKKKSLSYIYNVLKDINFPARNELFIKNNVSYYLEAAHNLDGITKYVNYRCKKTKINAIFCSLSDDKDINKIYKFLSNTKIKIFYFQNSSSRSIKSSTDLVIKNNIKIYNINKFDFIIKKYNFKNVIVLGSFYFYYDIINYLRN